MANIENPAAIFSAEGLKMFIAALTGGAVEKPIDSEVDSLVKEYFNQEPKKENVYEVIRNYLYNVFEASIGDIQKYLASMDYEYQGKALGPLMRALMKRYPEIKKTENKTYIIEGITGDEQE